MLPPYSTWVPYCTPSDRFGSIQLVAAVYSFRGQLPPTVCSMHMVLMLYSLPVYCSLAPSLLNTAVGTLGYSSTRAAHSGRPSSPPSPWSVFASTLTHRSGSIRLPSNVPCLQKTASCYCLRPLPPCGPVCKTLSPPADGSPPPSSPHTAPHTRLPGRLNRPMRPVWLDTVACPRIGTDSCDCLRL